MIIELINPFINQASIDKETTIIGSGDLSAIEFQRIFNTILSTSFSESSNKRLIITIENLDRLQQNDVYKIFSMLQLFFYSEEQETKNTRIEPFFIIPCDTSYLSEETNDQTSKLIWSSIVKRFNYRFSVPKIPLPYWNKYFIKMLRISLPDHTTENNELEEILHVFLMVKNGLEMNPTPRAMISFINQLAVLHKQFSGLHIPITHIAYFAAVFGEKNDYESIIRIITSKTSDAEYLPDISQNLAESFAMMLYSSDKEHAIPIFVKDEVAKSISNSDSKSLDNLAKNYSFVFWKLLENPSTLDLSISVERYLWLLLYIVKSTSFTTNENKRRNKIETKIFDTILSNQTLSFSKTYNEFLEILSIRPQLNNKVYEYLRSIKMIYSGEVNKVSANNLLEMDSIVNEYISRVKPIIGLLNDSMDKLPKHLIIPYENVYLYLVFWSKFYDNPLEYLFGHPKFSMSVEDAINYIRTRALWNNIMPNDQHRIAELSRFINNNNKFENLPKNLLE